MSKILVITNDEKVRAEEYHDFKDIQRAVGGTFDIFSITHFSLYNENSVPEELILHCNDEALLIESEEFNKVNAAAALIDNGSLIYGNIAVLIDAGEGESRGFTDEEATAFTEWLNDIMQKNHNVLKKFHEEYDSKKPEPKIEFFSF